MKSDSISKNIFRYDFNLMKEFPITNLNNFGIQDYILYDDSLTYFYFKKNYNEEMKSKTIHFK